MAGPWEKYTDDQSAASADGPWAKYQPQSAPKPSGPGAGQAALEHFGNAASLGYLPQLQSLASKLTPDPGAETDAKLEAQGFKINQQKPTYLSERDANIKRLQQESQEHPVASLAGAVGGSLATGIAASGALPINAASRIGRIAQAAKGGAVLGALSNPGDTEGEVSPIQAAGRVKGAVAGGLIGGGGQGVVEGVSSAAKAVAGIPAKLTSKAEERAFKASGAMLRDYRKAAGQDRINEIGRFMLDNGLIKPGMSVEDIAQAASKLKDENGKAIGTIIEELGTHEATAGGQVSRSDLANEIRNKLIQEAGTPSVAKSNKAFGELASEFENMGDKNVSVTALQKLKNQLQKEINWDRLPGADIPTDEQFNRAAYTSVKDALEKRADSLAEATGRADYKDLKSAYRNSSDVAKIAKDQALRKGANNFFSLGDKISGGAGFAAGFASGDSLEDRLKRGALGAGAAIATKTARSYGTPIVSIGLDKLGRAITNSPLGAVGKAAVPILNAAERTPVATSNVARILSNPNFKRASSIPKVADSESNADRTPAKGPDAWAARGLGNLGISGPQADQLLQSKEGKQLLIEASDLPAGSRALENIRAKIKKVGQNGR